MEIISLTGESTTVLLLTHIVEAHIKY